MNACIHPEELVARCLGDREVAGALLDIFAACARSELETIEKAAADRDWQTLRTAVHALKGAAGNASADELYAVAAQIEEEGEEYYQSLETRLPNLTGLREATDRCLAAIPALRVQITL